MAYVYILRSLKNKTYYIGSTNNFERRIEEHQTGKSKYTKGILPVELVFYQKFKTLIQARIIERKLKKFKSRKIIEKIIRDGLIRLDGLK